MSYLGMKNDGLYVFANGEEIFIEHYEKKWNEILSDSYYHTELLRYGHKFRPRLVYWGYCAGKSITGMNANDYDAIAQVAICIELVHKASILLDDYIDGDTARHGIDAFHITHGPERTMIFSLNILCRSLRIINDTFMEYIDDSTYSKISMKLVIQTLEDMTLGVLRELDLSDDASMQKLDDVKEIMHLETASLITNSLLVGYLLSQNKEMDNIKLFQEIGKDLGYIFQVLNDLEPFCSKRNHDHKGSLNTDISRNRKNICVPLLYIYLTSKEKRKLENTPAEEKDSLLLNLFQKYRIQEKLFNEISNVCKRIHNNISLMAGKSQLQEWCNHFDAFVDSVIIVSKKRLE